jgi:hypothetical protein
LVETSSSVLLALSRVLVCSGLIFGWIFWLLVVLLCWWSFRVLWSSVFPCFVGAGCGRGLLVLGAEVFQRGGGGASGDLGQRHEF